jgi:hypothetical protein
MQKFFNVHGEDERLANLIDELAVFSEDIKAITYYRGLVSGSIEIIAAFNDGGYEKSHIPIINLNDAFDSYVYPCWVNFRNSTTIAASPKYYECISATPYDTLIARVDYPNATPWYKYKCSHYDKGWFKSILADNWVDNRLGSNGFLEISYHEACL